MKKLLFVAALGIAGFMSAKSKNNIDDAKSISNSLCILVFVSTHCGLNDYINWCPEYGDTFECLTNEADMMDYWNCL